MRIFQLLMYPANAVCDALGLIDENERGVVRMLINGLLWTALGVIVVLVV